MGSKTGTCWNGRHRKISRSTKHAGYALRFFFTFTVCVENNFRMSL